jgi:hypothetical protein
VEEERVWGICTRVVFAVSGNMSNGQRKLLGIPQSCNSVGLKLWLNAEVVFQLSIQLEKLDSFNEEIHMHTDIRS